jgi:hypothetical protein
VLLSQNACQQPKSFPPMVQLKDVINTMVDNLGQFAKEVIRVSQEVGTDWYVLFTSTTS